MTYTATFHGTRGSIPTPGADTTRYGGNTACVAVSLGGDDLVILDAGTGIRPLGLTMAGRDPGQRIDILLSHTHWDHIQGLPFFQPLYTAGNRVRIFGAAQGGVPLEDVLRGQMDPMVFPVPLRSLAAELTVREILPEEPVELDGFRIGSLQLQHPGTTLGYRLEPLRGGTALAYLTDNELQPGGPFDLGPDWHRRLIAFLRGTGTLIHDATYSESMIGARAGWGHSSPHQAVDLAVEAGVAHLVLFHHDPEHTDTLLDQLVDDARAYAHGMAPRLRVDGACEGDQLTLG